MTKQIEIQTCQFVNCSDLFDGLSELLDKMCETDLPFTWGDNNRSMVTASTIIRVLNDIVEDPDDVQLIELKARIDLLPEKHDTYVDMEN